MRAAPVLMLSAWFLVASPVTSALADTNADASASSDVSTNTDASVADASVEGQGASAPPRDVGTRWVFLAAVSGLVAGGLLALYRKKRDTAGK